MEWIDRLRLSLFRPAVHRTGPFHHGPLVRSSAYAQQYMAWRRSEEPREVLTALQAEFHRTSSGAGGRMTLIRSTRLTGLHFAIDHHRHRGTTRYVMDLFAERTIALGYHQQMSDLRIGVDGTHRERRYLKPLQGPGTPDGKATQRYGNVMIEASGPDQHLEGIKILITPYNDRLYRPAVSGSELLERLLAEPGRERSC